MRKSRAEWKGQGQARRRSERMAFVHNWQAPIAIRRMRERGYEEVKSSGRDGSTSTERAATNGENKERGETNEKRAQILLLACIA